MKNQKDSSETVEPQALIDLQCSEVVESGHQIAGHLRPSVPSSSGSAFCEPQIWAANESTQPAVGPKVCTVAAGCVALSSFVCCDVFPTDFDFGCAFCLGNMNVF